MQEADVVLTPIPQADGTTKNRPAILLRELPPYRDFLVCGVSTQLNQQVPGFDDIISPSDSDFAASGGAVSIVDSVRFPCCISSQSNYRFYWSYFIRATSTLTKNFE